MGCWGPSCSQTSMHSDATRLASGRLLWLRAPGYLPEWTGCSSMNVCVRAEEDPEVSTAGTLHLPARQRRRSPRADAALALPDWTAAAK